MTKKKLNFPGGEHEKFSKSKFQKLIWPTFNLNLAAQLFFKAKPIFHLNIDSFLIRFYPWIAEIQNYSWTKKIFFCIFVLSVYRTTYIPKIIQFRVGPVKNCPFLRTLDMECPINGNMSVMFRHDLLFYYAVALFTDTF